MSKYDYEALKEIAQGVEKYRRKKRAAYKSDLLTIVRGLRLATFPGKEGARLFSKFFREENKDIMKLSGYESDFTVWENLGKSKRI